MGSTRKTAVKGEILKEGQKQLKINEGGEKPEAIAHRGNTRT